MEASNGGFLTNLMATSESDASQWFDEARKSIEINVLGVLKTIFSFLPLVRKGTIKKIVNISSGMGDLGT